MRKELQALSRKGESATKKTLATVKATPGWIVYDLLIPTFANAYYQVVKPFWREDIKPGLKAVLEKVDAESKKTLTISRRKAALGIAAALAAGAAISLASNRNEQNQALGKRH